MLTEKELDDAIPGLKPIERGTLPSTFSSEASVIIQQECYDFVWMCAFSKDFFFEHKQAILSRYVSAYFIVKPKP